MLLLVLTEIPDISLGGNQTWPMFSESIGGIPRTDNLSRSLPLRESTPGCPSSANAYRGRKSDLPSQQPRKNDMLSQKSRRSDFASSSQFRESDSPYQQPKQTTDSKATSSLQQHSNKQSSSHLEENISDSFEMELNLSSKSYGEPALSSGNHFSVPGPIYKQGITDSCLYYNVNDSPKYLEGNFFVLFVQSSFDTQVKCGL